MQKRKRRIGGGMMLLPVIVGIAIFLNVAATLVIVSLWGVVPTTGRHGPPLVPPPPRVRGRYSSHYDNINGNNSSSSSSNSNNYNNADEGVKSNMAAMSTSAALEGLATSRRSRIDVVPRDIHRDVDDDAFCDALAGGMTVGSGPDRVMVHVVVSNYGHYPFLRNTLLSMTHGRNIDWRPIVFAIGANVCPALEADAASGGDGGGGGGGGDAAVVCIPYLNRLLRQLSRDEPKSLEQIRTEGGIGASSSSSSVGDGGGNLTSVMDAVDSTFYGWGAVEHKFLINAKLYALRDALLCGCDVFVTDTDVGFRSDPRPYFGGGGGGDGGGGDDDRAWDIVAQNDTNPSSYPLNINSGFMYWRWSAANIRLIHDIIVVPPFWHIDQSRVNLIMEERGTPHTILDTRLFPNGQMFLNHRDELVDDAIVAFHANYNDKRGEKEDMLRKMGLWYLPPG